MLCSGGFPGPVPCSDFLKISFESVVSMASSVSSVGGLADRAQLGLESQLHYMLSSSDLLIPGLVHSILIYSMKKTGVELLEVWKMYQSIQQVIILQ